MTAKAIALQKLHRVGGQFVFRRDRGLQKQYEGAKERKTSNCGGEIHVAQAYPQNSTLQAGRGFKLSPRRRALAVSNRFDWAMKEALAFPSELDWNRPNYGTNYGMAESFAELVEQVRTRSLREKEELKFLLERELIEEERSRIATNHRESEKELKRGKLKFSKSIADLKKSLES